MAGQSGERSRAMIDAHIHLWGAEVAAAGWLAGERTAAIRRPMAITEYVAGAGPEVEGVVLVTAEQSVAESARLIATAAAEQLVLGVVGWVDLAGGFNPDDLAGLVGIRHSVSAEDAGWLGRSDVRTGIAAFAVTGLVLEVLVAARDLADVAALAAEHPALAIVVDHLGDASVGGPAWELGIEALAACPNVRVKLSGDHATSPAARVVLDKLGAGRVMIGSDWPVSSLRQPVDTEIASLVALLDTLTPEDRDRVLTGTALDTYRLGS
ncbi:amidohydrolase family protein [Leifsonia poae]|uniref:amidohydrolase family protein n=1 Tax=Leifsonia poae TaxID=110933 RepID=UPI003D66775C